MQANDPEWDRTVRDFIGTDELNLSRKWAQKLSFNFIGELDRCFNRTP